MSQLVIWEESDPILDALLCAQWIDPLVPAALSNHVGHSSTYYSTSPDMSSTQRGQLHPSLLPREPNPPPPQPAGGSSSSSVRDYCNSEKTQCQCHTEIEANVVDYAINTNTICTYSLPSKVLHTPMLLPLRWSLVLQGTARMHLSGAHGQTCRLASCDL